jgi:hypothetical protein
MNMKMLAYCGLFCEQCSFKAAHDEQDDKHLKQIPYPFTKQDLSKYNCECCKGFCICGPCKIKPCASAKNIDSCADCDDFPCEYIIKFSNDGIPHHKKAVSNLYYIRQRGIDNWYAQIEPLLKCECGEKQTWYYTCPLHKKIY